MVKVILLGPYSGEILDVAGNIRRGMAMACDAAQEGFAVLPCWWDWQLATLCDLPMEWFLANTRAWIAVADAALLTEGWQKSKGCRGDLELCANMMIPAFESVDALKRWNSGEDTAGVALLWEQGDPHFVIFSGREQWDQLRRLLTEPQPTMPCTRTSLPENGK